MSAAVERVQRAGAALGIIAVVAAVLGLGIFVMSGIYRRPSTPEAGAPSTCTVTALPAHRPIR